MKHIGIITSYTNHIRWDNYGKCDYGDFASLNHHEYANKHGYSYVKKIVDDQNYKDWHPTWIKIDVIKTYLPIFDYVVWIDADAVFFNQEIKIEEFIDENIDTGDLILREEIEIKNFKSYPALLNKINDLCAKLIL